MSYINLQWVVNYIQILYLCILKQHSWLFTNASSVVNYIQILYLCILKQQQTAWLNYQTGCELHSNLVSLHSETTPPILAARLGLLWITFKSCIFAFWNNIVLLNNFIVKVVNYIQILYLCILKQLICFGFAPVTVVNYIQILYLCILKQQIRVVIFMLFSCELHSNLVSLHSETTQKLNHHQVY